MGTKPAKKHHHRRHHTLRQPERLEDRLAMDGAGFVHTDPPEDPDSIVGEASIVAIDDLVIVSKGTRSLRIAPLENDELPDGASVLSIKLVSATARGATVTISDDGKHLLYTAPGDEGFQTPDSFYYIVQTEDGQLGKANVKLSPSRTRYGGGGGGYYANDFYEVLEDSAERQLNVLANDNSRGNPTIIAVSVPSLGGDVRIGDAGQSLYYQPKYATVGRESFTYTTLRDDGTEHTQHVTVSIDKPYSIDRRYDSGIIDYGSGPQVLDPLANDKIIGPVAEPVYIDLVDAPAHVGTVSVMEDGRRLLYEPAEGFQGSFTIRYQVRYGEADHQFAEATFDLTVRPRFLAVPNWFRVDPGAIGASLDVLGNDRSLLIDHWITQAHYLPAPPTELQLRVVEVSAGSGGGSLSIADDGRTIHYTPAAGFTGDETFSYVAQDASGARQTAAVTLHVAPAVSDPSGVPTFATRGELRQYLIERAVDQYLRVFGTYVAKYGNYPITTDVALHYANFDSGRGTANDHSETNTQVDGVDEADIVETDGRYVYTFSGGQLAIIDLQDPKSPVLASIVPLEGTYEKMYLQGDRLTLLRSGQRYSHGAGQANGASVVVLDITDRESPVIAERTEVDGYIADSRAIGDRVYLVVEKSFVLPALEGEWIVEPAAPDNQSADSIDRKSSTSGQLADSMYFGSGYFQVDWGKAGVWRHESLNEYIARVSDSIIDTALPSYRSYDASGELVASGALTQATALHKPTVGEDRILSLVTLDAGDDAFGPVAQATSFIADSQSTVYMSHDAAYLFAYNRQIDTTYISKLSLEAAGTTPLVATGQVRGKLYDQFAADEYDGRLRIATTEQERQYFDNGRTWRQLRLFNNLLVLEQRGNELEVVGDIVNLAPTEQIHSVRFMGERAYVVTFRRIDPLFAIDLSDPTNPTVEGALKIPGFSNYLHPVGENYLIGIGRDADEITGRVGPFQITLFDVSDLSNPTVADQLTFEGGFGVNSEAWIDHHAVAFFEASGVLAVPLTWREQVESEGPDGSTSITTEYHAATWTIEVKTSGTAKLRATGSVEHPVLDEPANFAPTTPIVLPVITNVWNPLPRPPQLQAPRALRIGDALVTVSPDWLQVHHLNNPEQAVGELFIGVPVRNDWYTIEEDADPTTLEVLANDWPDGRGGSVVIDAVTQSSAGGTVTISDDGRSIEYTPQANFFGTDSFSYTVHDDVRGNLTARVTVFVRGTPDNPVAGDDIVVLAPDATSIKLDVLANDTDPDRRIYNLLSIIDIAFDVDYAPRYFNTLQITEVGPTSAGGTAALDANGQVVYQPAEGFVGVDTFTYTVANRSGLTDTATVTVYVGVTPPQDPTTTAGSSGEENATIVGPIETTPTVESPVETSPQSKTPVPKVDLAPPAAEPAPELIDDAVDQLFPIAPERRARRTRFTRIDQVAQPTSDDTSLLWSQLVDRVHDEREHTAHRQTGHHHDKPATSSIADDDLADKAIRPQLRRRLR